MHKEGTIPQAYCMKCRGKVEMKIALQDMGLPVATYEGNMADEREFDLGRICRIIDLFATETLGIKKITA